MVKKTKRWKHFHRAVYITNLIHFLVGLAPILVLCIVGWCSGTISVVNKLSLGIFGTSAVVLLIFETAKKIKFRTLFWILMLGLCICTDAILPFVIVFLSCSVVDEFILLPLNKFYKKKLQAVDTARETAQYLSEI